MRFQATSRDAADNRFGVPILDLSEITQTMLSATTDPAIAARAVGWGPSHRVILAARGTSLRPLHGRLQVMVEACERVPPTTLWPTRRASSRLHPRSRGVERLDFLGDLRDQGHRALEGNMVSVGSREG